MTTLWAFLRANWWRLLLVVPVLWVLLLLYLRWRQASASETDWRVAVGRREQLLAQYRDALDVVRTGGEEASQRVEDRYHDQLQEAAAEVRLMQNLLEEDRAAFAEAAAGAWGDWRAKLPALLIVVFLGASLWPAPAWTQESQTILLRQGDLAAQAGVLVIGSPKGLIDLRAAGGAGWWAPDQYLLDATACFTGCQKRVDAERARADDLVDAAKAEGHAALAVCDASCAARVADLARPEPFPWRPVLLTGAGSLVLGVVAGVLLASYL